jgi:hypothetical protein
MLQGFHTPSEAIAKRPEPAMMRPCPKGHGLGVLDRMRDCGLELVSVAERKK